jgi:hypothetical protein
LPLTPWSVYLFAAVMGLLWLSTVPPTNAIVAQIFGVQYMSMLGGFVFLSHQVGSFMGVWLGGKLYDMTGSYDGRVVAGGRAGRLRRAGQPAGARKRHRARRRRSRHEAAAAACWPCGPPLAALAAVFAPTCNPHLVVDLANRVWSCF